MPTFMAMMPLSATRNLLRSLLNPAVQSRTREPRMSLELYRTLKLSLSPEEFRLLPRNAAYKYELIAGEVWLTPRPRYFHALLDLATFAPADPPEEVTLRPLRAEDWEAL